MISQADQLLEGALHLIYTYARAKIITELHQVQIYLGDDLVVILPYQLRPWVSADLQIG